MASVQASAPEGEGDDQDGHHAAENVQQVEAVAGGSAHTNMVLPARLLGVGRELQLYGDPIGSSELAITEVIIVQPGQFIEWLLESGLARSTVGVY